jgi:inhibitor of cysteine peptidase
MKRIPKAIVLILVVAIFIFAAGCTEKTTTQENKTTEKSQVVTGNDSEKTINLKKGENFTLNLKENPTTGYTWELNLSKGLSILNDKYIQDPTSEGYTGVGGNHSWVIQATIPGSQQVNGIYKRSWENLTDTEEKFTLNVEVI